MKLEGLLLEPILSRRQSIFTDVGLEALATETHRRMKDGDTESGLELLDLGRHNLHARELPSEGCEHR